MEEKEKIAPVGTKERGLSGAALKWTAVITMFIDHATAMLFITWLLPVRQEFYIYPLFSTEEGYLYWVLRGVGRIAFPIYCFLLVEGFLHTRSIKKYLGRMLVFGLISEIPFDKALFGAITWDYQNVYFTLFLGLLGMWGITAIAGPDFGEQTGGLRWPRALGCAAVAVGCMGAAELLKTDYGYTGVAVILLLFLLRRKIWLRDIAAGLTLLTAGTVEAVGWVDFILFRLYNGERGRQPRYFFYAFYPGHLALLWLVRYLAIGM